LRARASGLREDRHGAYPWPPSTPPELTWTDCAQNAFDNGGHITTEEAVSLACVSCFLLSPVYHLLTVACTVIRTKNVFLPAEPSWNGRFMDYEGNAMPW